METTSSATGRSKGDAFKAKPSLSSLRWVVLLLGICIIALNASAQDPRKGSLKVMAHLEEQYLACHDEYCRAEKLTTLEEWILADIGLFGTEGRLIIQDIQPTKDYDWIVRFTIEAMSESSYRLHLQADGDLVQGTGVGLWGSNSIIRFSGPVRFPIRSADDIGGGWLNRGTREDTENYGLTNKVLVSAQPTPGALLFEGDPQDVLAFAMIDEGFTYLHGSGTVHLADGTIVSLPGTTQLLHGDDDEKPAQSDKVSDHPCSDISWVQKRLSELGYDPGPPDGVWGPKTKKALEAFQAEANLESSGELDDQTCAKLQ